VQTWYHLGMAGMAGMALCTKSPWRNKRCQAANASLPNCIATPPDSATARIILVTPERVLPFFLWRRTLPKLQPCWAAEVLQIEAKALGERERVLVEAI
jgi:hypothetical protein